MTENRTCPWCSRHCPLDSPGCSRGETLACEGQGPERECREPFLGRPGTGKPNLCRKGGKGESGEHHGSRDRGQKHTHHGGRGSHGHVHGGQPL